MINRDQYEAYTPTTCTGIPPEPVTMVFPKEILIEIMELSIEEWERKQEYGKRDN